MRKHRFRNSYLTSAVSVSLVLCLIGLECVLLLSAGALVTRMREKMTLTAVLSQEADTPPQVPRASAAQSAASRIRGCRVRIRHSAPVWSRSWRVVRRAAAMPMYRVKRRCRSISHRWARILPSSWAIIRCRRVMRYTRRRPIALPTVWRCWLRNCRVCLM